MNTAVTVDVGGGKMTKDTGCTLILESKHDDGETSPGEN